MTTKSKKKSYSHEKQKKGGVSTKLVTLRGVVIPVDWDSEGKVIATAISTHHEDEYLIVEGETTGGINSLLNEEVEITGWCKKKGDKKIVKVKTCIRVITDSLGPKQSGNDY
ncbi:MAG TPA: hypothetical protein DCY12_04380 [Candidatus Atribacteria bacterium]|nr:hypothetical protein [Candidatus Atribacteria bacterium]